MPFDAFETAIRALSNAKLSALERDINAQIVELQEQGKKVHAELAEREAGSGSSSQAASRAAKTSKPKRARRAKRGIGKHRQALMKIAIDETPGRQWLPVDLEARLRQEGDDASRDSIRNLVRQMVEDGEIARHPSGSGVTALTGAASSNGSPQESLSEAPT